MRADLLGAARDQARDRVLRDVVVVAIECTRRDAVGRREGVQLIQVAVRDQVGPQPAVGGPHRGVDENGHPPILGGRVPGGTARDAPGVAFALTAGIGYSGPLVRHVSQAVAMQSLASAP